jgi:hypothetical protein
MGAFGFGDFWQQRGCFLGLFLRSFGGHEQLLFSLSSAFSSCWFSLCVVAFVTCFLVYWFGLF